MSEKKPPVKRKKAAAPKKAAPKKKAAPVMGEAEQLARACAAAAADKKAEDIQIIDLRGISDFTDFFIVCSGTSDPQLKAISSAVRTKVREDFNRGALSEDGAATSRWVVIDFAQVIVHVFHHEARSFYMLEDLWGDAPRIPFEDAGE
ncbi:MAG TPA: ribosome silencing factor [Chthoniobacterales bacterium]|nr:ribosome silencing factor [Chthoniobacterales bacterium]